MSTHPKAWFLGPKAENQAHLETLFLEAFRDYCYWRRHFHPEDQGYVRGQDRLSQDFLQYQEDLHDHLFELLSRLKQSMPFFSPRYLGHMCKDLLSPGILGYFASMFYNQNNITQEAATTTLLLETEAIQTLTQMLGYKADLSWGHLCSGGTVANMEALWIARHVRLLPWQLALAYHEGPTSIKKPLITLCTNQGLEAFLQRPKSITVTQSLAFQNALIQQEHQVLYQKLSAFSVAELGMYKFLSLIAKHFGSAPRLRLVYSHNAHYSLRKSLNILGLGEQAAYKLPLDTHLRMNTQALHKALFEELKDEVILALVGVYGSTEEGAIDDFDTLVQLKTESENQGLGGFWLHGDACYGGYALSMLRHPQGKKVTSDSLMRYLIQVTDPEHSWGWDKKRCQTWISQSEAMGDTDSISLDPHKLGYLPYPAGAILYKNHTSRSFIQCSAPYINAKNQQTQDQWHTPYPGKFTLEGSRPGATSAAVWLTHKTIPLDQSGHGQIIAGTIAGTTYLKAMLQKFMPQFLPGIEVKFLPREADLNILCYSFSGTWKGQILNVQHSNQLVHLIYDDLISRIPQSEDFIVSKTSLFKSDYGAESLDALWGEKVFEQPEHNHLAMLRTVVMDPFLTSAQTRQEKGKESMVKHFVHILSQRLEANLNAQEAPLVFKPLD